MGKGAKKGVEAEREKRQRGEKRDRRKRGRRRGREGGGGRGGADQYAVERGLNGGRYERRLWWTRELVAE